MCAIYLHRVGINAVIPYGFILALLLLFSAGMVIRAYFGSTYVYVMALVVSLSVFGLATANNGDVLMLATGLDGEKPWAGVLGWALLITSFLVPFCALLLPKRLFSQVIFMPIWRANDKDLDFMLSLVDVTDRMFIDGFNNTDLNVETKANNTPVSETDKAIEQFIRKQIQKYYPNDVILGEEFGVSGSEGASGTDDGKNLGDSRRWIIDPIDGTKNFIRGVPICATLIGLEDMVDGVRQPVKSVVSAPMLKRRWWGRVALGTHKALAFTQFDNYKPQAIKVSNVGKLSEATLAISSRGGWLNAENGTKLPWFDDLSSKVKRVRGFGDFYSYMLLAQGAVDIATEPELELYDIAALIPIIKGAGGSFTDIDGNSWNSETGITSALATNGTVSL